MHIEDGILGAEACAGWYVATMAFVVPGTYEIRRRVSENPSYKPFVAMVGVAVFVISALHLPVPVTGSSSSPCGTALAALLIGPLATVVVSTIVLFFQAIFFGHGGITTIGANTFSMGISGGLSGYVSWKALRAVNCPPWLAAGAAGLVGDLMASVVAALELALSLHGQVPLLKQWVIFFMGYAPMQLPLAVAEGVLTSVVLTTMLTHRPELLPQIFVKKET